MATTATAAAIRAANESDEWAGGATPEIDAALAADAAAIPECDDPWAALDAIAELREAANDADYDPRDPRIAEIIRGLAQRAADLLAPEA